MCYNILLVLFLGRKKRRHVQAPDIRHQQQHILELRYEVSQGWMMSEKGHMGYRYLIGNNFMNEYRSSSTVCSRLAWKHVHVLSHIKKAFPGETLSYGTAVEPFVIQALPGTSHKEGISLPNVQRWKWEMGPPSLGWNPPPPQDRNSFKWRMLSSFFK